MTTNQIAYWANQERERANRAAEAIKRDELAERIRSNKANETIKAVDTAFDAASVVTPSVSFKKNIGGKGNGK